MRLILALIAIGGGMSLGAGVIMAQLGTPAAITLTVCLVLLDTPLLLGWLVTGRQLRNMERLYGPELGLPVGRVAR
jgi:hypothetical protein